MAEPVWLWWSSGKDSAWALARLARDPRYRVTGLVTTRAERDGRVPIHGTPWELVEAQARAVGLPLHVESLPTPCPNDRYEAAVARVAAVARAAGVGSMAFGDLFLEDIRDYRRSLFAPLGVELLFPLWQSPTRALADEMLDEGLRAVVTAVDTTRLTADFAGAAFDRAFLAALPASVDSCGERGEFHTYVWDGPMFETAIPLARGPVRLEGDLAVVNLQVEDGTARGFM